MIYQQNSVKIQVIYLILMISAHFSLKTPENRPLTLYMKQKVYSQRPGIRGSNLRGNTMPNAIAWWALTLVCAVLFSGEVFALMPGGTFLDPATSQATSSATTSPQAIEDYNKPGNVLSDAPDSVEIFPDMLQRVINFESEKLTTERKRFLKAERALQKRRYTQFRKILPTLVDYPLYPYLRYQYLKQRLGRAKQKELTQFFTDYASQPVATMLRRKLLKHSARHSRWKRYLTCGSKENPSHAVVTVFSSIGVPLVNKHKNWFGNV
jgi:hypothetical protein